MELLEVFKALSNESRLQILNWLKDPEIHFPPQKNGDTKEVGVCVSHIQQKSGLTQSTISQYLCILQKAGLVTAKRVGQWTYYKRNEDNIASIAEFIKEL